MNIALARTSPRRSLSLSEGADFKQTSPGRGTAFFLGYDKGSRGRAERWDWWSEKGPESKANSPFAQIHLARTIAGMFALGRSRSYTGLFGFAVKPTEITPITRAAPATPPPGHPKQPSVFPDYQRPLRRPLFQLPAAWLSSFVNSLRVDIRVKFSKN